MEIPTKKECLELLKENKTPENVIKHSKAVCKVALEIADKMIEKGINVNRELVLAGALLHDIERKKKGHSFKGAEKLKEQGFEEVSEITKKHGLSHLKEEEFQPKTTEEKIVFYADKLIDEEEKVSVEERFKRLAVRHNIQENDDFYYDFTKKIEKELKEIME